MKIILIISFIFFIFFVNSKWNPPHISPNDKLSQPKTEKSLSLFCRAYPTHCRKFFGVKSAKEEGEKKKLLKYKIQEKKVEKIQKLTDSNVEEIDSNELWQKFRAQFVNFLKKGVVDNGNSFSGLQLLPQGLEFDGWSYISKYIANQNTWSPIYETTPYLFSRRYEDFLFQLSTQPVDPSIQGKLNEITSTISSINDNIDVLQGACWDQWYGLSIFSKARYNNDFATYKLKNCFTLINEEERASVEEGKMNQFYANTRTQPDFYAQNAIARLKQFGGEKNFVEINKYQDFLDRCRKGQYSSFVVEVSEKSYYKYESQYSKSSGFSIIIVSYASGKSEHKLTTRKSDFQVKIGGKSWTGVHILPDPKWYETNIFSQWKDGPFRTTSATDWFGPNGRLSLVPKTLYFVYQPSVEFYLNKEDSDFMEKSSYSSFGINLFFVSFNMAKAKVEKSGTEKNNLFKVTITSTSDTPQLVAVDNLIL